MFRALWNRAAIVRPSLIRTVTVRRIACVSSAVVVAAAPAVARAESKSAPKPKLKSDTSDSAATAAAPATAFRITPPGDSPTTRLVGGPADGGDAYDFEYSDHYPPETIDRVLREYGIVFDRTTASGRAYELRVRSLLAMKSTCARCTFVDTKDGPCVDAYFRFESCKIAARRNCSPDETRLNDAISAKAFSKMNPAGGYEVTPLTPAEEAVLHSDSNCGQIAEFAFQKNCMPLLLELEACQRANKIPLPQLRRDWMFDTADDVTPILPPNTGIFIEPPAAAADSKPPAAGKSQ